MPPLHIALGILIAAAWGCNYTAIHVSLKELPPIFLCALRFFLVSFSAIFFIKKPIVPFRMVVLYGIIMFALQFSLMFTGISLGMTPGLASIMLQTQAFFTIFFALVFFKEKPSKWQIVGALISFLGIGLAGANLEGSATFGGFCFVLSAAMGWGIGSIMVKKMGPVNQCSLIVWSSLVAWPFLLAFSFCIESPLSHFASLPQLSAPAIGCTLYSTFISTCFGFIGWNWLIERHPISTVAPFTLLVPVFGLFSGTVFVGEPLYLWKIGSALLVISGLMLHHLHSKLEAIKKIFQQNKNFD